METKLVRIAEFVKDVGEEPCALIAPARICEGTEHNPKGKVPSYSTHKTWRQAKFSNVFLVITLFHTPGNLRGSLSNVVVDTTPTISF
ncbi:hypothetical protein [Virgibacillus pantothenticus]|uniref:hypothetical protein n=1 Tax=Virgibacillus pantothenticus TaxID=1473 RepID=UPI0009840B9E|nr:hypothetical protein [Virgibacillus pantothenticus]